MSIQSDAAKTHIEKLLSASYPWVDRSELENNLQRRITSEYWGIKLPMRHEIAMWTNEFRFALPRKWAFDYAVPSILCANLGATNPEYTTTHIMAARGVIELDGGIYTNPKAHLNVGMLEKNNAAMTLGWRVWHYSPDMVIKAGRKSTS